MNMRGRPSLTALAVTVVLSVGGRCAAQDTRAQPGSSRSTPRTAGAPFRELDAAQTKVFHVGGYGAVPDDDQPDGDAIRAALAAAVAHDGPARVVFRTGRYRLGLSEQARRKRPWQRFALEVIDGHDLVISGATDQRTELIITDRNGVLFVGESQRVGLENITIDFDPLPFSQGRILAVDADSFTYAIQPGFPVLDDPYFARRADKPMHRANFAYQIILRKGLPYFDGWDHFRASLTWEQAGERTFKVSPPHPGMRPGQHMVWTGNGDTTAFFFRASEDVFLRNVTVYSAPVFVTCFTSVRNVLVDGYQVRPRPGTGRWLSANKDGLGLINCRGNVEIRNCHFECLRDDAINMNGSGSVVSAVQGPGRFTLGKPGRAGFFRAGDRIQVFDTERGGMAGETTIIQATRRPGTPDLDLTVQPGVRELKVGLQVYNLSACAAGAVIRDSVFERSKGRVYIQSHDVLFTGNRFHGMNPFLLISPDHKNCAGPVPRNIRIVANRFTRQYPGGPVIWVDQWVPNAVEDSIRDIHIVGNVFENCSGNGKYWRYHRRRDAPMAPYMFQGARDVVLEDNTILTGP